MVLIVVVLCGVMDIVQAPVRPDLSGVWLLDTSKTTQTGAPIRVGGAGAGGPQAPAGAVTAPKKIKDVPPKYPPDAQRARLSGRVVLDALIDKQGKVTDLRVLFSVREFDQAAIDAVSRWEYTPTRVGGVPVEVIMTVTVTFSIDGAAPQMGVPVGNSSWPSQPPGAERPGMGRGFVSPEIEIAQNDRELTLKRKFTNVIESIKYSFDGRPSNNRLPGTGGAVDSTYVYVSKWEGEKLVSTITWIGPQGKRERTETLWIEGDVLKMSTSRAATEPGAEPFVTTNVFARKR